MATCSLADLQAKACDNGFTCLDDVTVRAIELQLWYKVAGSTLTASQLLKLACDNGFACANTSDDKILAATELQFLCNIKNNNITPPVPECTNLIPDGSVYQANGRFYLRKDINGINPDILQLGQTYVLTFGVNENSANNLSDGNIILPVNTPYTFTYPGAGGDLGFYLHTGIVTGLPVTATLCVAQLNQFNIDAFAGVGGSISPNGTTTVNAGDDLILTATPDPGYTVSQWLLDGNPVDGTSTSYTIAGVNADHTIEVQFSTVQLTPIMTSNNTPAGYVASASSNNANAWKAFAIGTGVFWISSSPAPQWVQLQFPTAHVVLNYFTSVTAGVMSWTLQGSNDGIGWTDLDSRSGVNGGGFNIASPASWSYYRMNITACTINPNLEELQLYGA